MVVPVKGVRLSPEYTTKTTGYRETDQINDTFDALNGSLVNISDSLKYRFKQLLQTQLRLLKYKSFDPETEEFKYLIERNSKAEGTEETNMETNIDVHEDISKRLLLLRKELSTFDTIPPSDYRDTDTEGYKLAAVAGIQRIEMPSGDSYDKTVHYNTQTHVEMMAKMNANRNAHQRDQKLTRSEKISSSTPVTDTAFSGRTVTKGYRTKTMTGNDKSSKDKKRSLSRERPDTGPGRAYDTGDAQKLGHQSDSMYDESKSVSYRCQINSNSRSPDHHPRTQQRYHEIIGVDNRPTVTEDHALNRTNKNNKIPVQASYRELTEAVKRNKGKSDSFRHSPPRGTEYISDDRTNTAERTPSTGNKTGYMATRKNRSPERTSIATACDSEKYNAQSNSTSLQTSFNDSLQTSFNDSATGIETLQTSFNDSATGIETETGDGFKQQSSRNTHDHGQRLRTSCTNQVYSEATRESSEAPVYPPRSGTEQRKHVTASPAWSTDTGRRWQTLEEKIDMYLTQSGAENRPKTMSKMDRGNAQSSYQNGKRQPAYNDHKKCSDAQNYSPRSNCKRSPNETSYNVKEETAGNIDGHSETETTPASDQCCEQTSPDRIATRNNSALDKWAALKKKLKQIRDVYRHEQMDTTNSIRIDESNARGNQGRKHSFQSQLSPETNINVRSRLEKGSPRLTRLGYTKSPSRKSPFGSKALRSAIATRKALLETSRSAGSNIRRSSPECICLGCTKSPVRKLSAGNKALADTIATRNALLEPSKNASSRNDRFAEFGGTQCPYRRKAVEDALATRTALLQALSENDHLLDFQNESCLEKEELDNDDPDLGDILDDESLEDGANICRNEAEVALNMLRAELNDALYDIPSTSRLEKARIEPDLGELMGDESDPSDLDLVEVQGDENFEGGTNACSGSDSEVAISMVCTDLKDRLSKRLASSISKSVTEAVEEAVENDANMDRMKATTQALCRVRKSLAEVDARLQTTEDGHHYLQNAEEEVYKSIGDMLSVEERLYESHVHVRVQHVIQRLEAVAWLSGSASYRSRVTDDLQPIIAQLRYLEEDLKNGEVREEAVMPFRRVAARTRLAREQFQVLLFLVGLILGLSIIVVTCQVPVSLVHVDTPRF